MSPEIRTLQAIRAAEERMALGVAPDFAVNAAARLYAVAPLHVATLLLQKLSGCQRARQFLAELSQHDRAIDCMPPSTLASKGRARV